MKCSPSSDRMALKDVSGGARPWRTAASRSTNSSIRRATRARASAFALGGVQEFMKDREAVLEAGNRQLLLARKIVGDAGCAEPDQFGDMGEPHALEALPVKDRDGRRDDVQAPFFELVSGTAAGLGDFPIRRIWPASGLASAQFG